MKRTVCSAVPVSYTHLIGYKVGSVAGMILAVPAGIIVANMYQAGFFDTTIDSVRILVHGFNPVSYTHLPRVLISITETLPSVL